MNFNNMQDEQRRRSMNCNKSHGKEMQDGAKDDG